MPYNVVAGETRLRIGEFMTLLLAIIYLIFISLGLPDSLFGAAWPVMHLDFGVAEGFASVYMIITAVGSGGVSFFAGPLIRKFGTGRVTVVSVFLTVAGMLIIGLSVHIAMAIAGSILMGLGAGAIDTGLNNFVSTHYKARHMNWLHAFWGIGVTLSPLIMSAFLDNGNDWRAGYRCVSYIQAGIFLIAALSLPLWKKYEKSTIEILDVPTESANGGAEADDALSDDGAADETDGTDKPKKKKIKTPVFFKVFRIPGVLWAVLSLGLYISMEFLIGTWGASYAVNVKSVAPAVAARWISVYYGGIMAGRIISGFVSFKTDDKTLVRAGIGVMIAGMIVFALPIGEYALTGLLLIGLGFGPVFPSTIHSVPYRFGTEYSADITGIQMGGSYAIGWAVQLAYGFIAPKTTFAFTPYLLIVLAGLLLLTSEITNKITSKRRLSDSV
ncbi:MAG: MFS transporter [Christensenellaceae bacterium]|nr:MFS transporter [Christensenellaceae bacterium]